MHHRQTRPGEQCRIHGLRVEIVRKPIKNLYLRVYPPDGRVRVTVPGRASDLAVRSFIGKRVGWIQRQQQIIAGRGQPLPRAIASGEDHYYQGRRYRLQVIERRGAPVCTLVDGAVLQLRIAPGVSREKREAALLGWYRQRLREQIAPLVARWQPRLGVTVAEWRIKRMRSLWGSCNIGARRIWLNLELAKEPAVCLEYVVVHEMVHLLERYHNERFKRLMDAAMPRWREYRKLLASKPGDRVDG